MRASRPSERLAQSTPLTWLSIFSRPENHRRLSLRQPWSSAPLRQRSGSGRTTIAKPALARDRRLSSNHPRHCGGSSSAVSWAEVPQQSRMAWGLSSPRQPRWARLLFMLMGVAIVTFTLWTLYIGVLFFRQKNFPLDLPQGYVGVPYFRSVD